jgi:hypothetical protein
MAGVFLGAAILCKPNYEIVPLAFLAGYAIAPRSALGQRLRLGVALGIGLAIVVAPWYIRNEQTFGEFFLSRTYDDNISRVAAVATLAEVNHESVQPWSPRWEEIYGSLVNTAAARYQWDNTQPLTCRTVEQERKDVAAISLQTLREHPQAFVLSHVKSTIRALLPQEQFYWYERITGRPLASDAPAGTSWLSRLFSRPPILLGLWAVWLVGYAVIYLGLVFGSLALRHQPHLILVMLALIFVGLVLPGPLSYIRFRVPVAPAMVVIQTVGLLYAGHFLLSFFVRRCQLPRRRHSENYP